MEKPVVYFTKEITPEAVVRLYHQTGLALSGNVAVKLHSGEAGNQNFLKPDFFKLVIEEIKGTVVECNTAYDGMRNSTDKHIKLLKDHGWSKYFKVDLLDAEGRYGIRNSRWKSFKEKLRWKRYGKL